MPVEEATAFFCRLLKAVYSEDVEGSAGTCAARAFASFPRHAPDFPFWKEELPSWTKDFLLPEQPNRDAVKYLLTFRPFGRLPANVRKAYLTGKLHLLPSPPSLAYWGVPGFRQLHRELPLAHCRSRFFSAWCAIGCPWACGFRNRDSCTSRWATGPSHQPITVMCATLTSEPIAGTRSFAIRTNWP